MGESVNSLIDHATNEQQLCEAIQAEDLAVKLVKATEYGMHSPHELGDFSSIDKSDKKPHPRSDRWKKECTIADRDYNKGGKLNHCRKACQP